MDVHLPLMRTIANFTTDMGAVEDITRDPRFGYKIMKLLRFGPVGQEKPGLLDADGRVRDLSGVVADVAGAVLLPAELERLRAMDPASLPLVPGVPQQDFRLGPCVAGDLEYGDSLSLCQSQFLYPPQK